MEVKKTDIAHVEKRRSVFFMIGLVLAIGSVLTALKWTSRPKGEVVETTGSNNSNLQMPVEQKITPVVPHLPVDRPTTVVPSQASVIKPVVTEDEKTENTGVTGNTESTSPLKVIDDVRPIPLLDIKNFKVQSDVGSLNEPIYMKVEEMPRFKGEDASSFREWIQNHIRYPQIAIENGISGRVRVQFSVNQNGEVVDVVVVRSIDPVLDKEAVRVIKSSPKWTPGRQRGKAVKVQFNFPVSFELQQLD